jgi:hypothetical protein
MLVEAQISNRIWNHKFKINIDAKLDCQKSSSIPEFIIVSYLGE